MAVKFDPILGKLRQKDGLLKEYDNTDPSSPKNGEIWLKKTFTSDGTAGEPRGLLLVNTYAGAGVSTYQISVKTENDGIKRVSIT